MLEAQILFSSYFTFPLIQTNQFRFTSLPISPPVNRPLATTFSSVSALNHRTITKPWVVQVAENSTTATVTIDVPSPEEEEEEGPIELDTSIFSFSDSPTPLQTATSVLLTGAVSVFLFRSLRRRAKRAKELKFRSSGAEKSLKEEALESLNALTPTPIDANAKAPPSPVQAFLGAFAAGVIALILYKFTTTIEASLNRQTISDNFSVRQITITIRTIINGICYLATFVFGINSVGLFLYSGQLALNSFMGDSTKSGDEAKLNSPINSLTDDSSTSTSTSTEDPSSDKNQ